jgi:AraC family transcriptional regulator, transcriptional activator of pobA
LNNTYLKIEHIQHFCKEDITTNFNPHSHPYHSLYYVAQGFAVHKTENTEFHIKGDTIVVIPANIKHQLIIENVCKGIMLNFSSLFLELHTNNKTILNSPIFKNSDFRSIIDITGSIKTPIINCIKEISELSETDFQYKNDLIAGYLMLLILYCTEIYTTKQEDLIIHKLNTINHSLKQFSELIELYFQANKNVSFYSDLLNVNTNYLNQISKRITGISAGDHIRNRVILEAQKMLITDSISAKEIAFRLGYEDPAYFNRLFKNKTGMSMIEYRKKS